MPDTQAAYRGLKPQTALMRAASGMSRTIDPRRPRKLSLAQKADVDRHPEVRLLRRRLKSLLQTFQKRSIASMKGTLLYNRYRQTYQAHRNLKRRLENALFIEVKERYKKEQPVIDIQRQLQGLPAAEQENLQVAQYVFAERVQAIDTLFTFATSSTAEECQRRAAAINALTALCKKQDSRGFRRRNADIKVKEEQTLPSSSPPPNLSKTLKVECKATQCIFCLGNEELPDAKRLKPFASRGDLKKHFHRKHLRHHPIGQPIACPHPRCDVVFERTMYLQNHVEKIHKIRT